MSSEHQKPRSRGPVALTEIVGKVLDPVVARRGLASADLIAAWPGIAGAGLAAWTAPERIVWPRGEANASQPGVLMLRVDGPRAVYVQHELPQIIERVNAFFGYRAVGRVRIVQGSVAHIEKDPVPVATVAPEDAARLEQTLAEVEDEPLKAALGRLGRGVLATRKRTGGVRE